jgi:RNA 2',3'-cyclic 3'-phosphodiesterase
MAKRGAADPVRTFLAIHPSPEQREAIGARIGRLADALDAQLAGDERASARRLVRWVGVHQAHLTLAFLGSVDRPRLDEVVARVAGVVALHRPFPLALGALDAFPDLTRPRVLVLGVRIGGEAVVELAHDVRRALAPLGFEIGATPFRPHLTLGRVRRGARAPRLGVLSSVLASTPAEADTAVTVVREVTIMASRLGPQGAEHELVEALPLGGPPAGPAAGCA